MVFKRRRSRSSVPQGFYRFEGSGRRAVYGFGDGEFVRLRDEFGAVWRGQAEVQTDNTIRLRLRDSDGRVISGISDPSGIVMRDERGNVWRGFLD